jgi:DNA-binding transcriptional LysR family regulator
MLLPEIRLLQAAVVLAEELNYSRAAVRLRITQPALTKRIEALERQLDVRLFDRNHQRVQVTESGARLIAEAREAIVQLERAVSAARIEPRGADDILRIGNAAYIDPWLTSLVRSVHLPLYPRLQIAWTSHFSHEVANEVLVGTLDLGLVVGIPPTRKLSCLKLAEQPMYIGMKSNDPLAALHEVQLSNMHNRIWALFSKHLSPYMYEAVTGEAKRVGVHASNTHHVTSAEEAVPLILEYGAIAFLSRTGAWRIARDGITLRPLAEENLKLVTLLAARADTKSRLIQEFVKATGRKVESIRNPIQTRLPLSA